MRHERKELWRDIEGTQDIGNALGDKNFYERVGLQSDATDTDIKKRKRKGALLYHPDKVNKLENETPEEFGARQKQSELKFKEFNAILEILSDPSKRAAYDRIIAREMPLARAQQASAAARQPEENPQRSRGMTQREQDLRDFFNNNEEEDRKFDAEAEKARSSSNTRTRSSAGANNQSARQSRRSTSVPSSSRYQPSREDRYPEPRQHRSSTERASTSRDTGGRRSRRAESSRRANQSTPSHSRSDAARTPRSREGNGEDRQSSRRSENGQGASSTRRRRATSQARPTHTTQTPGSSRRREGNGEDRQSSRKSENGQRASSTRTSQTPRPQSRRDRTADGTERQRPSGNENGQTASSTQRRRAASQPRASRRSNSHMQSWPNWETFENNVFQNPEQRFSQASSRTATDDVRKSGADRMRRERERRYKDNNQSHAR